MGPVLAILVICWLAVFSISIFLSMIMLLLDLFIDNLDGDKPTVKNFFSKLFKGVSCVVLFPIISMIMTYKEIKTIRK